MTELQEIKDTFALIDDWEDRYAYLIDLGRHLPDYPDDKMTDDYLVRGCTSRVWMVLGENNGQLKVRATSDAHVVRGLIALVIAVYDNTTAVDRSDIDMMAIFTQLGLGEHLSPNRRNGFFAMVEVIKNYKSN